jgi:CheY-like chemotaxis protein
MTDNILVIDDDPVVQILFKDFLCSKGYTVHTAGTVAAGLDAISKLQPVVVMVDLLLPDGSGSDILAHLAEHPQRGRKTASVVLSAHEDPRNLLPANVVADEYLAKPFSMAKLLETVQRLLPPGS